MRPPEKVIQAKRKELRIKWAREDRKRRAERHTYSASLAAIRVAELNRLIDHWYGERLSNDKDGQRLVEIVANHLAALKGSPQARLDAWATIRAPWLTVAARDRIVAKCAGRPIRWKADTLAAKIRLTCADRDACRITTIGATDFSAAERLALRKEKKRARERARRQAQKMLRAVTGQ